MSGGTATAAEPAVPPQPSTIQRIRLYNFRNYSELNLELEAGLNVFVGQNAQGKSNLLEAVATLLLTRSPRATTPAELLRWGCDEAAVDAVIAQPPTAASLGLRLRRSAEPATAETRREGRPALGPAVAAGSRRVSRTSLLEGKPVPARSVLGRCPVVLFWPDDLQLVKGGPEARRHLVDTLMSQLDHRGAEALLRYRRVLEQRNALLRQVRLGAPASQLDPFDAALARHGARVQVGRAAVVTGLDPIARSFMGRLSGDREQLRLRYRPGSGIDSDDEQVVASALLEALARSRNEDLARGITLTGPHRDDLDYLIDGRPARPNASQGQQRSAVLASKLAELAYARDVSGRVPVLLLDDVLSELDQIRRGQLLDALMSGSGSPQTLVTSVDGVGLERAEVRVFAVREGRVLRR